MVWFCYSLFFIHLFDNFLDLLLQLINLLSLIFNLLSLFFMSFFKQVNLPSLLFIFLFQIFYLILLLFKLDWVFIEADVVDLLAKSLSCLEFRLSDPNPLGEVVNREERMTRIEPCSLVLFEVFFIEVCVDSFHSFKLLNFVSLIVVVLQIDQYLECFPNTKQESNSTSEICNGIRIFHLWMVQVKLSSENYSYFICFFITS